ncbi:kinase-like domain-containing protein [Tribonema minus]|uniref:Kinase-like domain-containing protein n=1 Tax=Tribonema minus TaxID=303371 RepID=A0A835YPA7_9STRA|nr:kinase-like domain-containing protein [Tribonema minus]
MNEITPYMEELTALAPAPTPEGGPVGSLPHETAAELSSVFSVKRAADLSPASESARKLLLQHVLSALSAAEAGHAGADAARYFHSAAVHLDILKTLHVLPPDLERVRVHCRRRSAYSSTVLENLVHEHLSSELTIEDHYVLHGEQELGKGTYGRVVVATHRGTAARFACKVVNLTRMEPRQRQLPQPDIVTVQRQVSKLYAGVSAMRVGGGHPHQHARVSKLYAEVSAMRVGGGHPHVVRLREVFYANRYVYLVMDMCGGGELFNLVTATRGPCAPEPEMASMLSDMLSAVAYLHRHRIVHRDIKLENWMLSVPGDSSSLKLIDFGLSRHFGGDGETMYQAVGSTITQSLLQPVSPQVLLGNYTEACDLWSMGVIAYMMLSGAPPFWGSNDVQVRAKIIQGHYEMPAALFGATSPVAQDFVRRLLTLDATARMTAEQALAHPFLRSVGRPGALPPHAAPLLRKTDLLAALRAFSKFSGLKQLILQVAARTAGEYEPSARGLIESFKAIAGTRGTLSFAELSKALQGYVAQAELQELFQVMSAEGGGEVTCSEALLEVSCVMDHVPLVPLSLAPRQLQELFHVMSAGGGGEVTCSEFLAATMWTRVQLNDAWLRLVFQALDKDGKGYLTSEGLQLMVGSELPFADAEAMIAEADLEGTGLVFFAGFLRFWRENGGASRQQKAGPTLFGKASHRVAFEVSPFGALLQLRQKLPGRQQRGTAAAPPTPAAAAAAAAAADNATVCTGSQGSAQPASQASAQAASQASARAGVHISASRTISDLAWPPDLPAVGHAGAMAAGIGSPA